MESRPIGMSSVGWRIMDDDRFTRLTQEIDRFYQHLEGLRAELTALVAEPAKGPVLFRRLTLRIEDVMARLHGVNADLMAWHAMLPKSPYHSPPRAPDHRHNRLGQ